MSHAPRSLSDHAVHAAPALFVVLWASGFIGAKFGLPYADPLTFLAIRMGAVVALIAIVVAVSRPSWPSRAGVGHSIIAGLLVHGLYLGGVFIAIHQRMPAGLTALVVSLQPVIISTVANRLFGERVLPRQWLGLLLGFAGVVLVVRGRAAGDVTLLGWAAAFVGLIGITAGTLYQKRFGGGIDWRPGFLVQYAAAGSLFGVAALALETREVTWSGEFVFALGWLVLVLSFGAVWVLYFLIRRSAAARVASLFYLTPPLTALMGWTLFGETLDIVAIIGMGVSVAGVFLVNAQFGKGKAQ